MNKVCATAQAHSSAEFDRPDDVLREDAPCDNVPAKTCRATT